MVNFTVASLNMSWKCWWHDQQLLQSKYKTSTVKPTVLHRVPAGWGIERGCTPAPE